MKTNKEIIQVKKTVEGWCVVVGCELHFNTNKEAVDCCNKAVNFIEPFEDVAVKSEVVVQEIEIPEQPEEEAEPEEEPSDLMKKAMKNMTKKEQAELKKILKGA